MSLIHDIRAFTGMDYKDVPDFFRDLSRLTFEEREKQLSDLVWFMRMKENEEKEASEQLASDIHWILSRYKSGIESKDRTIIFIEKMLDKYFDEVNNKGDDNNGK